MGCSMDSRARHRSPFVVVRRILGRPANGLFASLCLILIVIKLLFAFYPGDFPAKDQAEAFSWPVIGFILLIGLAGLLADRACGFPEPLSDRVRDQRSLLWSIATGAVYGLITITLDIVRPSVSPLSAGSGWDHVPWPWSIPFYLFGAIFMEFLLRLGALCIPFWLVHVVVLRRRWRNQIFWLIAVVVALYEIWPYLIEDVQRGRWAQVVLTPVAPLYWTNVLEAWLLARFGWFAPIVFRLAFYLMWHVLYGGFARGLVGR